MEESEAQSKLQYHWQMRALQHTKSELNSLIVFDITARGLLTNDPLDPDYVVASILWHKVL